MSEEIHRVLYEVYSKYRRKYPKNPDSKQMCCMWSTTNPPDNIIGTDPLCDIEDALDIYIEDADAFELYDMTLYEAEQKLIQIIEKKC